MTYLFINMSVWKWILMLCILFNPIHNLYTVTLKRSVQKRAWSKRSVDVHVVSRRRVFLPASLRCTCMHYLASYYSSVLTWPVGNITLADLCNDNRINAYNFNTYDTQYCILGRSQPDDLVPLCKYCHVYKLSTQSISKEINNDELTFA
jgi:hypothetical protein